MSSALDRLKKLTNKISGYETTRKENIKVILGMAAGAR